MTAPAPAEFAAARLVPALAAAAADTEGWIQLFNGQGPHRLDAEVRFRKIELLDLEGCMDPKASNFKGSVVEPGAGACRY